MRRLLPVFVLAALASGAFAVPKLKVGDPAPAIKVGKWVKGQAVSKLDPAKVYVIEFWATWCPPCRQSIPHLTDLAKKYKGKVTFAGVSVWERGDVAAFVKEMGAKMNYSVATDNSANFMAKSWMEAAGENGIPTAFVIGKKAKVFWIGHPMGELENVLDRVLSGKFNVASYAKLAAEEKAAKEKRTKVMDEVETLTRDGKAKEALAKLDKYLAEDPSFEQDSMVTRLHLLFLTDQAAGYAYASKLGDGLYKDNASFLAWLAGSIVDEESVLKNPQPELALSIADRAEKLGKDQNAQVLYTLSMFYEKKGDTGKAIACEEKAVRAAEGDKTVLPQAMEMLKSRLQELKSKK